MRTTPPQAPRENDQRLAFKRMPRSSDGDGIRKVLEMGSLSTFPSTGSITTY
jgi:hypothetical protein